MEPISPIIRLNPIDDVVIARRQLIPGTVLEEENGLRVAALIPAGHKMATRAIAAGEAVKRYGQIIGTASQAIEPGQHVHTHNLAMAEFSRAHSFGADFKPVDYVETPATFMGIVRPDGRVATRNYIGVLTSVNCSATAARAIADYFRRDIHPQALADFPNVDGVVALTHGLGCAVDSEGEPLRMLRRTLAGYAKHANFAAVLIVGLGCETNQISGLLEAHNLKENEYFHTFTIQSTGGTAKTVALGIEKIMKMLPAANQVTRQAVPASHLTLGLQCGWLFRHHGQSGAGGGCRFAGAPWRYRDPVGNTGNLWRRTLAHAPCGLCRSR